MICKTECEYPKWCVIDGAAPTAKPVSTTLVKQQAAIDPSDDTFDPLIDVYIESARKLVQDWIGKTLITTNYLCSWSWGFPDCLKIQDGPNFILTKISYIDVESGDWVDLDISAYQIDSDQHFINIYPDTVWPDTPNNPNVIRAYYAAGFGVSDAEVPAEIKLALAQICTQALGQRGDCGDGECNLLPTAMKLLRSYKPYRVVNVNQ